MTKILPPAKFRKIRPPNENYTYFEDKDRYPFRPNATTFELVNSAWLADFALLVYGNETFVRKYFKLSGLTDAGFDFTFFDKKTTQCFAAHNRDFVVVSLRGTDRKSTRLNSSHIQKSRMPSSA